MDHIVPEVDNDKTSNFNSQPKRATILRHCSNVKDETTSFRLFMNTLKASMRRGRSRMASLAAVLLMAAVLLLWLLRPPMNGGSHMTTHRSANKLDIATQSNTVVHRALLREIIKWQDSERADIDEEAKTLLLALADGDRDAPHGPSEDEEDVPHGSTEDENDASLAPTDKKGHETPVPIDYQGYEQLAPIDGKFDSSAQATSRPAEERRPSRPGDGRATAPVATAVTVGENDLVFDTRAELDTGRPASVFPPQTHAAVAIDVSSIANSDESIITGNAIAETTTRHANESLNPEASSLRTDEVSSLKTCETSVPTTPEVSLPTTPAATSEAAPLAQSTKTLEALERVTEVATYETTTKEPTIDVATVYIGFSDPGTRLGNKMFQYASGLALALRYHRPAVLVHPESASERVMDDMRRFFRLSPLPVLHKPPPPTAINLVESGWGRYDTGRFDSASTFEKSVYTVGYFQSWKYFAPVADHVRREFTLTADAERVADSFFRSVGLLLPGEHSSGADGGGEVRPVRVGVHVRRGDMLRLSHLYTVAPAEYLLKAIAHYRDKYAAPHFNVSFVFATDDHAWVQDLIASRLPPDVVVRYVSLDAGGDMAVLSRCDHSIVTGGTFGWWAAWLAGGDVVYYKDFIRPESPLYASHDPTDYYPPNWLGMTA